jgi:diguanylate cyclase (GGDEF)-like protein/PAS domain S-box-containing protein
MVASVSRPLCDGEALRLVLAAQRESLRARAAAAVFVTAGAEFVHPGVAPVVWLGVVLASLLADGLLRRRLLARRDDVSLRGIVVLGLWLLISNLLYASIASYFWLTGGDFGRSFALILGCAGLVQTAIQLRSMRWLMSLAMLGHAGMVLMILSVGGFTQFGPVGVVLPVAGFLVFVSLLLQLVRHNAAQQADLIRAKREAELERAFTASIIESIPNLLFVVNARTGCFELINKAAERITGIGREIAVGRSYDDVYTAEGAARLRALDAAAITTGRPVTFEDETIVSADGTQRTLRGRHVCISDDDQQPRYVIGVAEDVTEVREAEAQVVRLAYYDSLTELPNRVLFRNRLDAAFDAAASGGQRAALLCIDLDHFKEVNDGLGHLVGDQLLMEVAERLNRIVRPADIVARLGGDEFAILQIELASRADVEALANRVVAVLSQPFHLSGRAVRIGASLGIAFAPEDGVSADELIMHADMALYHCKQTGRGGFRVFEREMNERRRARRMLEQDLRRAFAEDSFSIAYQPQLNVQTGHISGCEALMRLELDGRILSPAEFIPVAEEIGLISQIGEWILRQACAEAATWPAGTKVAVNISPAQVMDPNLIRTIISALAHAGLSPDRLEVEITEGTLLQNNQANLTTLFRLRELGVQVALDDFGTGFSSLNYLRQFPFTKIKIDKSFVSDLSMSLESVSIVKAITGMATSLGMKTTAEGVENERQLDMVRSYGCTEIQGFLISPPCTAEQLSEIFARFAGDGSSHAPPVRSGDAELWLAAG